MSDLCVLVASVLAHAVSGWSATTAQPLESPAPSSSFGCRLPSANRSNPAPAAPTAPTVALHRPEFSNWAKQIVLERQIKPRSGGQLFVQRWAALQTGKLYTRLPAHSFHSLWQNASYHPTYENWVNLLAHEAKAAADGQGSEKMAVLLGDSLAQWFPIDQLNPDRFWLNQGISGDTTGGVLKRLSLLKGTQPDRIYVMAGINDLKQGAANREILQNLQAIVRQLKAAHPNSQIYLASILPTRLPDLSVNRIRRLNYNIRVLAQQENIQFFDLHPAFADAEGKLQAQLTVDGLHLNASGYRVWQAAMTPIF